MDSMEFFFRLLYKTPLELVVKIIYDSKDSKACHKTTDIIIAAPAGAENGVIRCIIIIGINGWPSSIYIVSLAGFLSPPMYH